MGHVTGMHSATSGEEERKRKRECVCVWKKRETIIIAACSARVDHARDLAAGTRRRMAQSLLQKQSAKAYISELEKENVEPHCKIIIKKKWGIYTA